MTLLDAMLSCCPPPLRAVLRGLWYAVLLCLALFFAFEPQTILPYARF